MTVQYLHKIISHSFSNVTGHHDITLDIKGVGFIASVVRSMVHAFDVKKRIKRVVTNEGKTYQ